jgi:hypothetical protein
LIVFVVALAVALAAKVARADGMPAYLDRAGWHLLPERSQQAFVALRDHTETLVIQVAAGKDVALEQARRLAWIVPIPAPAEAVHVDVVRGFPRMKGVVAGDFVSSEVRGVIELVSLSQIYPAILIVALGSSGIPAGHVDALVHETVRRDGVDVEVVSAGSPDALAQHLQQEELPLPSSALAVLEPYARPGSSFVLYRVADLDQYRRALREAHAWPPSMGVEVRFPADEGFFPLAASAALPGPSIDVVVTVLGHVTPSAGAPPELRTQHCLGALFASDDAHTRLGLADLAPGTYEPYTRMTMRVAPSALAGDLRFRPGATASTRVATALVRSGALSFLLPAFGVVLFAALSVLSALAARHAWPTNGRPTPTQAALLGLANLFTIVGVFLGARAMARRLGAPSGAARRFTVVFSLVFSAALLCLALST